MTSPTEPAVFEALYADWKLIKTRGVVQVVLEFDLRNEKKVYAALDGMPNPAAEVWVGVARLNLKVRSPVEKSNPAHSTTEDSEPNGGAVVTSRQPPNPYAKRAGILCNDVRFQKWLSERYGIIPGPDAAATKVRELCEVESRAEILPETKAAKRFDILESAYRVDA